MSKLSRPYQFVPPKGPPRRSSRQRVLAAWRGLDTESEAVIQATTSRAVSALMPRVLQSIRFDQRMEETKILQLWKSIIDPTITAHAQPTGLVRGTLFITVDSNVWLTEIVRWRQREILQKLQLAFGKDLVQRLCWKT